MGFTPDEKVKLYTPTKREKIIEKYRPQDNRYEVMTEKLPPNVQLVDVVALPPHLYIPRNGMWFDQFATMSIPAGSVETTIISYRVPSGYDGWIKYFGQDVSNIANWPSLTWYLKINDTVVPPYGAISRQLGTFTEMTEALRKASEGDTIKMSALNSSLSAIVVWGRIKGWIYPMR